MLYYAVIYHSIIYSQGFLHPSKYEPSSYEPEDKTTTTSTRWEHNKDFKMFVMLKSFTFHYQAYANGA